MDEFIRRFQDIDLREVSLIGGKNAPRELFRELGPKA
jgi:hypothetical protein